MGRTGGGEGRDEKRRDKTRREGWAIEKKVEPGDGDRGLGGITRTEEQFMCSRLRVRDICLISTILTENFLLDDFALFLHPDRFLTKNLTL